MNHPFSFDEYEQRFRSAILRWFQKLKPPKPDAFSSEN
jgi:hypothetical protein